jgi:hypothetical protein
MSDSGYICVDDQLVSYIPGDELDDVAPEFVKKATEQGFIIIKNGMFAVCCQGCPISGGDKFTLIRPDKSDPE